MYRPLRFGQLSPPRQSLIRLCQSMNYGSIQDLTVRSREPIFTPSPPLVLTDVKLDADEEPRCEADLSDFVLSIELVRLMLLLDQIEDGKITKIEIRAGIPRRVAVERSVSACLAPLHTADQEELKVACREAGRI
jgi:hypothetical protein